MEYIEGDRKGMIFHPHDWAMIEELFKECDIIYREEKTNKDRVVILKKSGWKNE